MSSRIEEIIKKLGENVKIIVATDAEFDDLVFVVALVMKIREVFGEKAEEILSQVTFITTLRNPINSAKLLKDILTMLKAPCVVLTGSASDKVDWWVGLTKRVEEMDVKTAEEIEMARVVESIMTVKDVKTYDPEEREKTVMIVADMIKKSEKDTVIVVVLTVATDVAKILEKLNSEEVKNIREIYMMGGELPSGMTGFNTGEDLSSFIKMIKVIRKFGIKATIITGTEYNKAFKNGSLGKHNYPELWDALKISKNPAARLIMTLGSGWGLYIAATNKIVCERVGRDKIANQGCPADVVVLAEMFNTEKQMLVAISYTFTDDGKAICTMTPGSTLWMVVNISPIPTIEMFETLLA